MADKKITELTSWTTPIATDVLPIVDITAGATKKIAYSDLTKGQVAANGAIVASTQTKITYDAKGLVTVGAAATTADIADSSNARYCTDAEKTVIGNTSGTNSGDASGHGALAPIDNPSFATGITTPVLTIGSTAVTSSAAELNLLDGITVLSGSNTGDQSLPVKAIGSELDTGTDDAKFATALAIATSHNVPSVAPGNLGNVMTSDGTDWTSAVATGGGGDVLSMQVFF